MKIALLYHKYSKIAETANDHLWAFGKYSAHDIIYIDSRSINKKSLQNCDVIVIHYTLFMLCAFQFPPHLKICLRYSNAKKVVFIQDEYRRIDEIVENLSYIKADLLFTCFPEREIEKVYSSKKLPFLKKVSTLTGFVPERLLKVRRIPYDKRALDVVYRARKVPDWLGRLGYEKWYIAEKFNQDAKSFPLACNISYEESKRIYGGKWVKFLSNSKAALGCESGSSVCDFTGKIQKEVEDYKGFNPMASFEEISKWFLSEVDGKIEMNQISPRCFECAALGTLMILYEGRYSGILVPWRHYVPLKKDHSNMEEIVAVLKDKKQWEKITKSAYEEVACNPAYSYKNFIKGFDEKISKLNKSSSTSFITLHPFNDSKNHFIKKRGMVVSNLLAVLFSALNKTGPVGYTIVHRVFFLRRYYGPLRKIYKQICELSTTYRYALKIKISFRKTLFSSPSIWQKDNSIFQEFVLLVKVLGYIAEVKDFSGISFATLVLNKKQTIIFLGDQDKLKGQPLHSLEDIPKNLPLKLVSSSCFGLPKDLRNLDYNLAFGKEILELLKQG